MSLLASTQMDIGLLVIIMIVGLKYALKDKDYKGFKWIVIGGLLMLLVNNIFFLNFYGLSTILVSPIRDLFAILIFAVMLIGSIQLIIEFIKE